MTRKIIHCDCDCFFAAVEMRDDPRLRGRPLAVGGDPSRRGVIATCNYEARAFGVRSAMASAQARKLCPELLIIPGNGAKYREASLQVREIFHDYAECVEPLSLDEAYLDVTDSPHFHGSATRIAEAIRRRVRAEVGITVSAGVAPNKFLAKVASDWRKPDGLTVIPPERIAAFVAPLPVVRIHGVGQATAAKLDRLGVTTCADLQQLDVMTLTQHFGSFGRRLYELSRGIDERPVQPSRRRKSLSVEHTFSDDLPDLPACQRRLPALREEMLGRLAKVDASYQVHKLFVKVKFNDFSSTTVEQIGRVPALAAYEALCEEGYFRGEKPVRLLGLGVRFREPAEADDLRQLSLFENTDSDRAGFDNESTH